MYRCTPIHVYTCTCITCPPSHLWSPPSWPGSAGVTGRHPPHCSPGWTAGRGWAESSLLVSEIGLALILITHLFWPLTYPGHSLIGATLILATHLSWPHLSVPITYPCQSLGKKHHNSPATKCDQILTTSDWISRDDSTEDFLDLHIKCAAQAPQNSQFQSSIFFQ